MRQYQNILIIKMSALGDIIHALPSLAALRELFPQAVVNWLVEPQFADILPGKPYIDEKIIFDKNNLKRLSFFKIPGRLWELRRILHSKKYDLVLDLQGLLKSTMIAVLSGCRNRLGYCEMREGSFLFTKPVNGPNAKGHIIQRYLDVIRYLGPISDEVVFPLPDYQAQKDKMRKLLLDYGVHSRPVLLFPGAGWASKLWPIENYAKLAKELSENGYQVALGGGKGDAPLTRAVMEKARPLKIPDLTGQTDLTGLLGLVSLASVCVGSDTGPLHLAAAAGIPTVSLFGPSSGQRAGTYGPLGSYVSSDADCSPCFKRVCPREFFCMERISPQMVLDSSLKAAKMVA
ncbi:MAG: glycosyltransferase family 9 protein [Deltaproteobacteria bacterium]|jgi:heptosyltransferase-1/heptosyltransferase-2|nr:glycosyltransferase family 9 protein [Deltaproteobacteria bacterium]